MDIILTNSEDYAIAVGLNGTLIVYNIHKKENIE
jgi:hypothetical protein